MDIFAQYFHNISLSSSKFSLFLYAVTKMLSFRVLMHLSASLFLISSVTGKKYLVETEDFDPQSRNRFAGFGQGGPNQAAPTGLFLMNGKL